MRLHHLGQNLIQFKKEVDSHAKVGCVKKSSIVFLSGLGHLWEGIQPAGRATNHWNRLNQCAGDIIYRSIGDAKVYGSISFLKVSFSQIHIYFTNDFMTSFQSNLFYRFAHSSIS